MAQSSEKIIAVVVSFNPDTSFIERLIKIMAQVHSLVIIDNGSEEAIVAQLSAFQKLHGSVHVIANRTNVGLAKAQNQGIEWAIAQSADWVLLLDDDSVPSPKMVENLLCASQKQYVAMLAPQIEDQNVHKTNRFVVPWLRFGFSRVVVKPDETREVLAAIASGSLVRADIFIKEGLLKNDYFIDYIDTEFCLRLVAKGYNILAVGNAALQHRLGEKTTHSIGRLTITPTHHSPERRYTIYRNRMFVWRSYITKVPSYIIYDMLAATYDIFRIVVFEKNRRKKLINALKGLVHGLFTRIP